MAKDKSPSRGIKLDRELEEFRQLMEPPSTFEDGFSWAAFLGAIFVAILMVPGAIYISLIAEASVGPAAQWVTLILFIEVARRANKTLKRAEIFTLFYIAGAIMAAPSSVSGGFHGGLGVLWSQFYVQSTAAQAAGIAEYIPAWVAPTNAEVLDQRSLFIWEWLPAIALGAFTMIIGRIDNMILGYGLFRLTSDIERLPFPMAPLGAQGVMALSEEQEEESSRSSAGEEGPSARPESWRWRVFSIGSVIGLVFGTLYLGLPTVTGALLDSPIKILPIPFIDYTQSTAGILPAVAMGLSLNLGSMIFGMVMPYWAVVGTFVGLLITVILNPILYDGGILSLFTNFRGGILKQWNPGDNLQATFYKNNLDFYFSFSIGVSLAIAIMGIWAVIKGVREVRRTARLRREEGDFSAVGVPEGRGDIKTWLIFATYLVSTGIYITVSMLLLTYFSPADSGTEHRFHWGVFVVMLFYGFFYTPLISYVTARLEGIAGQVISIPFVKEASFILSGYNGVAVWFLPVPLHNYGQMTVFYRQCELTGTKFWSIWKAEILLTPIVLIGSLMFAHFIWSLGEIPSAQYPYAMEWWEVTAEQQSIIFSSTLGGFTVFEEAIKPSYIGWGLGLGMAGFIGMQFLGAPIFLVYGVIRGLGQTLPFGIIPEFIGALLGRYYFQKRLGLMWRQYIPVVGAGFSCGMGLIATLGIGFTFLAKSVFKLPF